MPGTASYDYEGCSAIVTGSTRGIGRGIAAALARAGANLVVNSRDEERVNETVAALAEEGAGRVVGFAGDVSDPETIETLVETAVDTFGQIDLLVNNAAVWPENPIHERTLDDWDWTFGVNVRGPFYTSVLVAERMIEAGIEGSIINVSSGAGERHGNGHGLYGVSKSAKNGLTWRLAHDLAPEGIRVNAVSTDQTDSHQMRTVVLDKPVAEATEEEVAAAYEQMAEGVPLGRVGQPADLANAVLFLGSEQASYVTGHVLRVSGGRNLV